MMMIIIIITFQNSNDNNINNNEHFKYFSSFTGGKFLCDSTDLQGKDTGQL